MVIPERTWLTRLTERIAIQDLGLYSAEYCIVESVAGSAQRCVYFR